MSNKDLFKEAIADAKAVREAALANAKVALEEALAPKLQNMISAKLQKNHLVKTRIVLTISNMLELGKDTLLLKKKNSKKISIYLLS